MTNWHTESALSDKTKKSWMMFKTKDHPCCGSYFYQQIDQGVWLGKIVEVPFSSFNRELREILNNEDKDTVKKVIFRAIKELAVEKSGGRDYKDRIKWRFV